MPHAYARGVANVLGAHESRIDVWTHEVPEVVGGTIEDVVVDRTN